MRPRRAILHWTVRLSVQRFAGRLQLAAVTDEFERGLAGQESPDIVAPHVESELRRGRDYVRIVVVMTVAADDVAGALELAWWAFREAAGSDLAGWDTAAATAEVRPELCLPGPGALPGAVTGSLRGERIRSGNPGPRTH